MRHLPSLHTWVAGLSILLLLSPGNVRADRADSSKPMDFKSQSAHMDDLRKTMNYTGQVRMTQGSRQLTADKVVIRQDAAGFSKSVSTGSPQKPAHVRQRENDGQGWMEGWAERIEYDDRTDKITFFDQAHIRTSKDEAKGDVIIYDNVTERYQVLAKGQAIPDAAKSLPAQPMTSAQQPVTRKPSAAPSNVPLPGSNLPAVSTTPDGRAKAVINTGK
ncbi:MAG: lipopolysaccharide transport periplasmic protein LptA [Rhodocyclaceae bacterium]|nr:lipopolysaccharide transport periplasmic protein LptA [Rhodocyclaceae bacterium]